MCIWPVSVFGYIPFLSLPFFFLCPSLCFTFLPSLWHFTVQEDKKVMHILHLYKPFFFSPRSFVFFLLGNLRRYCIQEKVSTRKELNMLLILLIWERKWLHFAHHRACKLFGWKHYATYDHAEELWNDEWCTGTEGKRVEETLQVLCNWTKLSSQGHGICNFEKDKISENWIESYGGISHRKLLTALQLKDYVFPTQEFLARCRQGKLNKTSWHYKETMKPVPILLAIVLQ